MRLQRLICVLGSVSLCAGLAGAPVSAQDENPAINVFFGFDLVLFPLAVKWACGGERAADLSRIDQLITAFPQDAARAELRPTITVLGDLASDRDSLGDLLGFVPDAAQANRICAAALPLDIAWMTPEDFSADLERALPEIQKAAWSNFFEVVETLQ